AMGIMVDSFRHSLREWLGQVLVADFYATAAGESRRPAGRLDPAWVARVRADPEVAGVTTYLYAPLSDSSGPIQLVALQMDPRTRAAFHFLEGDSRSAFEAFARSPDCGLLASEAFAYRRGLHAGQP